MVGTETAAGRERQRSSPSSHQDIVVGAFFGLLSAVLGVIRTNADASFWRDEAVAAVAVSRPFSQVLRLVASGDEAGMGGYLLGLKTWSLLGSSDRSLRYFSVLGGVIAAVVLVVMVRRWFGTTAAWLAGLLLVTNPTYLFLLNEVRSYSWTMAAAVVTTALVVHAATTGRRSWFLAYGLAVGVGLSLHFAFLFIPIAHALGVLITRPDRRRALVNFVLAGVVALVVVAPFVPAALTNPGQVSWIPPFDLRSFATGLNGLAGDPLWLLIIAAGLSAFAATQLWGRRPSTVGLPVLIVFLVAIIPPVGLAAVSIVQSMFLPRYMAASVPFLAACAAVGFTSIRLPARVPARSLITGVAVLAVLVFLQSSPLQKYEPEDLRAAAAYVEAHRQPGDVVLFYPMWARSFLARYWRGGPDVDIAVKAWEPDRVQPTEVSTAELRERLQGHPRVWLLGGYDATGDRFPEPVAPLLPELKSQPPLDVKRFGEFEVRLVPNPAEATP